VQGGKRGRPFRPAESPRIFDFVIEWRARKDSNL